MYANCSLTVDQNDQVQWLACMILLSLLSLFGVTINISVLIIFSRLKCAMKNSNLFLITLVVGNLILSTFVGPFRVVKLTCTSDCGISLLDCINALILIPGVSNGVISYDRYLHVALLLHYREKMKGHLLYTLLSLPWISSVVYLCSILISEMVNNTVLLIIALTLFVIVLTNYVRLIRELHAHTMSIGETAEQMRKVRNHQVSWLCVYVMAVDFTCGSPGFVTLLLKCYSLYLDQDWSFWLQNRGFINDISLIFFLLSACMNPFVYLYRHREFKCFVRRLVKPNRIDPAIMNVINARKVPTWQPSRNEIVCKRKVVNNSLSRPIFLLPTDSTVFRAHSKFMGTLDRAQGISSSLNIT